MKKLYEYDIRDIHKVCEGIQITIADQIIVSLEIAEKGTYLKDNNLTVGYKKDQNTNQAISGYINHKNDFNNNYCKKYINLCEIKMDEHFNKLNKQTRSRLELITE